MRSNATSDLGQGLSLFSAVDPVILDNETCAYCGNALLPKSTTKEHVIGRNFVPKGKLFRSWNLIVRACTGCNNIKSDLEDDLSAIAMHPDGLGRHASPDTALHSSSVRKSRGSFSRRTGASIADSCETLTIEAPIAPGLKLTFNLWAPPQAMSDRVYGLARLQLVAFFYWLTYDRSTRQGRFWRGALIPVIEAMKSDWGNSLHVSFMRAVAAWEPRLLCNTAADGFFKVAIRKHPAAPCWSWALEWNQNVRLVGFFGDLEAAHRIIEGFTPIEMQSLPCDGGRSLSVRTEVTLAENDDVLFASGKLP